MLEIYSDLIQRMYKCNDDITKFKQSKAKVELIWMYTTVTRLASSVGKEQVECRRLNRITDNYNKKFLEFQTALENLEYYITIAYLTKE